jgi:hypothetical protein
MAIRQAAAMAHYKPISRSGAATTGILATQVADHIGGSRAASNVTLVFPGDGPPGRSTARRRCTGLLMTYRAAPAT